MGAGYARNVGFQYAKGRYVLFADADDFYHESLNFLFDDYQKGEYDIVFFNVEAVLKNPDVVSICLNDGPSCANEDFWILNERLQELFNQKHQMKSSYEI